VTGTLVVGGVLRTENESMHWNFRTFVRLFLLVGGTLLLVWGLSGGDTLNAAVGALAVVLGAFGLAYEYRESTQT